MSRLAVAAGLLVWIGAAAILSGTQRFRRPALVDRLRPFHAGSRQPVSPVGGASIRDMAVPFAEWIGGGLAALFGVRDSAALRLRRIHSEQTVADFRLRQLTGALVALLLGAAAAGLGGLPVAADVLATAGLPLLVALAFEQQLVRRSERWQASLAAEMPVIAEQLGMLLSVGYSLGASVARLASRSQGNAAKDLRRVTNRWQQGVSQADALREWAEVAGIEAVSRLVAVLTLHADAPDLARLVAAEARQTRRDLHRKTIEILERRSEQVWVPVTVATLLPGAVLLAVPFLAALKLFAGS